ncbi:AAA family ATPase [Sinorhizobium meliloti]|uniref:DNA primase n=1 Tax=Rhizobium meliloti TaxID=382 RepID=A0A2J0YVS0_RHIML|nr:AAA family ATPase [Sinorhizobium meliloti]PJR11504.1 DNA primase [Sinorhizobium meliloti]
MKADAIPVKKKRLVEAHRFIWHNPATIPRRECLYPDLYYRGFATATVAPGGIGKSGLCLVEAVALASGRDLLRIGSRFRTDEKLRVWYWNGEDPFDELERQVHAICQHYRIDRDEIDGHLFLDSGRDMPIKLVTASGRDGFKVQPEVLNQLEGTIGGNGIELAIFDPLANFVTANANSNEVMAAISETCATVASHCGCGIGLVHHPRKTNGAEITAEDARGGGALIAGFRVVRVLNRMTAAEAEKAGIPGNGHRRYFRATLDKINLTPPRDDVTWRYLEDVVLPNGDPYDLINPDGDHVRVVVPWRWPNPFDDVQSHQIIAFQDALERNETRNRASQQSTDWVGHLLAEILELDTGRFIKSKDERSTAQNAARNRCAEIIKQWIDSGMLTEETVPDEKKGRDIPVVRVGTRYA